MAILAMTVYNHYLQSEPYFQAKFSWIFVYLTKIERLKKNCAFKLIECGNNYEEVLMKFHN